MLLEGFTLKIAEKQKGNNALKFRTELIICALQVIQACTYLKTMPGCIKLAFSLRETVINYAIKKP